MEDNVFSTTVPKNDSIFHKIPVIVLHDLNKIKKVPSTNESNNLSNLSLLKYFVKLNNFSKFYLECQHPKNILTSEIETEISESESGLKRLHTENLQKSKRKKTSNVSSTANPVQKERGNL